MRFRAFAVLFLSLFAGAAPVVKTASLKSVGIHYHFADKHIDYEIDGTRSEMVRSGDAKAKTRKLSADDLLWIEETLKNLKTSKDKKGTCKLTSVDFDVTTATSRETFTVCRQTKTREAKLVDEMLTVLAVD